MVLAVKARHESVKGRKVRFHAKNAFAVAAAAAKKRPVIFAHGQGPPAELFGRKAPSSGFPR